MITFSFSGSLFYIEEFVAEGLVALFEKRTSNPYDLSILFEKC
jgi:hypothetical protein